MSATGLDSALLAIEESIVTIVRHATLPRVQERLVADAGVAVERSGYGVLKALDAGGVMSVGALAHLLGLDVSTMSRRVASLQRAGLVVCTDDPSDGRVTVVSLARAGRRAMLRVRDARRRLFAEVLAAWDPQDCAAFAEMLARLASDLENLGGRS